MARSLASLALVVAALAGPHSAALGQDPPPAPAPAPVPVAVPDPAAEREILRKEMEETFLRVKKDFEALTGAAAADTLAALEKAVAEESKAREKTALGAEETAAAWTKRTLLGPEVAARLAARLPEAAAKAAEGRGAEPATLGEALRLAVRLVFPEPTLEENWDRGFLDLDVVVRWNATRPDVKAVPAVPPGPVPAPAPGWDAADMVFVPRGDLAIPEQRGRGWPHLSQKAEKRAVKAFWIDRTEVPVAAYAAFLRDLKDAKARARFLPNGWRLDDRGGALAPEGTDHLPVTGLPYEGAAAFAAHHGKRLPTEDEWERAARGNFGLRYPWGADWVEGNAVAGGKAAPLPVGTTPGDRSPFGAMDMAGNVSEYCATYPDGKPVKALPKETEQVLRRGGNFEASAEEAANDWRYVIGPTARSKLVGFRCAMDEKAYEARYGKK